MVTDNICTISLIDAYNKETKTAQFLVKESNCFYASCHFQEPGLIEHFIQSISMAIESKYTIMEIKDFSVFFLPKCGETIVTDIKLMPSKKGISNVLATAKIDGVVAAKCKIRINLNN